MKIAILSCTKSKLPITCEAYKLYSASALFSKTYKHVQELRYDEIYILSAKYGLLHPQNEIAPYELSIHDLKGPQKREWLDSVWRKLELYGVTQVDFWCGKAYYVELSKLIQTYYPEITINIPMQGMGIGKRLAFLTK